MGDAHGGTIAGTPTRAAAARDYTLTATDADGDHATLSFRLSVADPSAFRFARTVAAQWYLTGVRVSLALPEATGGGGDVTYALSPVGADGRPALPAGLSFAAEARVIACTPTGTKARTTYTLTATDAANNRAGPPAGAGSGLPVVLEVRADTVPTFGSRTVTWPAAAVQTPLRVTLPAATGGNGVLSYVLSPAGADGRPVLPAGLSYTAPTDTTGDGTLSGTPTPELPSTTYTLTVADGDANVSSADADTLDFAIAVTDAVPTFGDRTIAPQRYTQGQAVSATLPAAQGGEAAPAYTVSPGLPSGLRFDAATREIAGTPLTPAAAAPYSLVATDGEGTQTTDDDDSVSLAFTIAVADPPRGVTIACADPDPATSALEVNESGVRTCTAVLDARPTGAVMVSPTVAPAGDRPDVGVCVDLHRQRLVRRADGDGARRHGRRRRGRHGDATLRRHRLRHRHERPGRCARRPRPRHRGADGVPVRAHPAPRHPPARTR